MQKLLEQQGHMVSPKFPVSRHIMIINMSTYQ